MQVNMPQAASVLAIGEWIRFHRVQANLQYLKDPPSPAGLDGDEGAGGKRKRNSAKEQAQLNAETQRLLRGVQIAR